MVAEYRNWPTVLEPNTIMPNPVPFTRSGGRSLGGFERNVRTDRGYWAIQYRGVALYDQSRRKAWNAIRTWMNGASGLVVIPVWSFDSNAAAVDGSVSTGITLVPHSDHSPYADQTFYAQPNLLVQAASAAAIGDTSISLRLVHGLDGLEGIRFSYNNALYETGFASSVVGDIWTLDIFPAVRAPIPADAWLEFDLPTCLVRLASDREMDVALSAGRFNLCDVAFTEAADYWADLAAEEAQS